VPDLPAVLLSEMEMVDNEQLKQKFLGCLIGAALGDAVGAFWEGRRMAAEEEIKQIAGTQDTLRYTDDTHMTIGVAESLIENRGFNGDHMAERFADNYFQEPWRGYGPGPPRVFQLLRNGEAWDKAASHIYPGGSFGNGAAMRVAPVGLLFRNNPAKLREVAYQSSLITHSHVLGMEGAAQQARAVALAVAESPDKKLDVQSFISSLLDFTDEDVYCSPIMKFAALLQHPDDRQAVVRGLGHGIEAFNSVPTAIFSFLAHPGDFASTIVYAISLGGDTDTIASMAGAISGAYLGIEAIPQEWQERLENRDYILNLAERLWHVAIGQ
jgi:poly(ADP-ribose) glycohydrolase ARH3